MVQEELLLTHYWKPRLESFFYRYFYKARYQLHILKLHLHNFLEKRIFGQKWTFVNTYTNCENISSGT